MLSSADKTFFTDSFDFLGLPIGRGAPVAVIAEAGVAHFGDARKALDLVDLAAEAGADVFKMQHFQTEYLVSRREPHWFSRMESRAISNSTVESIAERCHSRGIPFLCTPHDLPTLDFLDKDLNVAAFKVGSGEVENWDFIREVFSRGKPTIVSIGMYRQDQFTHLLELARSEELRQIAVLHCNTAYPTMPKHVNLLAMGSLREQFDGPIGYSDHTEGHEIPLAAVALGAQVIEKHISLDFGLPDANDWKVSCGPEDFASFVTSLRKIEQARGLPRIEAQEHELESKLWARKSISASRTLEAGHTLRTSDLIMLRPGDGLSPERINDVLGRTLTAAKEFGDLITLADVD